MSFNWRVPEFPCDTLQGNSKQVQVCMKAKKSFGYYKLQFIIISNCVKHYAGPRKSFPHPKHPYSSFVLLLKKWLHQRQAQWYKNLTRVTSPILQHERWAPVHVRPVWKVISWTRIGENPPKSCQTNTDQTNLGCIG